jgi:cell division topological specificity factor
MNSLNRLLGRPKNSSNVAKDRLRQTLVYDRTNLSPGKMDRLQADLAQVISCYVEIDQEQMKISLTDANRQSCLTAHVPVIGTTSK